MITLMDQRLENFRAEVVHSDRERPRRIANQPAIAIQTDPVAPEEEGKTEERGHKPIILLVA